MNEEDKEFMLGKVAHIGTEELHKWVTATKVLNAMISITAICIITGMMIAASALITIIGVAGVYALTRVSVGFDYIRWAAQTTIKNRAT